MTQTTDAALVPEDMQALRVQNSAFRALNRSLEQQIEYHRVRAQEYHAATTTLDSEREANRILTDTIEAQARRIEALEGDVIERCAKVVDDWETFSGDPHDDAVRDVMAVYLAEAIRALAITKDPTP